MMLNFWEFACQNKNGMSAAALQMASGVSLFNIYKREESFWQMYQITPYILYMIYLHGVLFVCMRGEQNMALIPVWNPEHVTRQRILPQSLAHVLCPPTHPLKLKFPVPVPCKG